MAIGWASYTSQYLDRTSGRRRCISRNSATLDWGNKECWLKREDGDAVETMSMRGQV